MNQDLIISSLRDKGCKITDARKEVIKIFSQSEKPLSAGLLHQKLLTRGIKVNKTTVYRELSFLVDKDFLIEVYLKPREVLYEAKELVHHHHLVCEVCGNIENITNCLVQELEKDVYRQKGFKVKRHSLEFYGVCAKCK